MNNDYNESAAIPDDDTLEAFDELDSGGGYHFCGTAEQLFAELMEE